MKQNGIMWEKSYIKELWNYVQKKLCAKTLCGKSEQMCGKKNYVEKLREMNYVK